MVQHSRRPFFGQIGELLTRSMSQVETFVGSFDQIKSHRELLIKIETFFPRKPALMRDCLITPPNVSNKRTINEWLLWLYKTIDVRYYVFLDFTLAWAVCGLISINYKGIYPFSFWYNLYLWKHCYNKILLTVAVKLSGSFETCEKRKFQSQMKICCYYKWKKWKRLDEKQWLKNAFLNTKLCTQKHELSFHFSTFLFQKMKPQILSQISTLHFLLKTYIFQRLCKIWI